MKKRNPPRKRQPPNPGKNVIRILNADLPRQQHESAAPFIRPLEYAKCPRCKCHYSDRMRDPNSPVCEECRAEDFAQHAERLERQTGMDFGLSIEGTCRRAMDMSRVGLRNRSGFKDAVVR